MRLIKLTPEGSSAISVDCWPCVESILGDEFLPIVITAERVESAIFYDL
jgi:hypothetical protein